MIIFLRGGQDCFPFVLYIYFPLLALHNIFPSVVHVPELFLGNCPASLTLFNYEMVCLLYNSTFKITDQACALVQQVLDI